ncbi:MAG: bile acid:sodium symporter [bacterium]
MFCKMLRFLSQKLSWSMPIVMLIGLIYGYYYPTDFLKILVLPFTLLMVYPIMVNLQVKKLLKIKNFKLHIFTQFINFAVIPAIAFLLGKYFFAEQPILFLGLLLIALLPTSGMTISWTGFANGNITAAVIMTVIGLLLGSLLAPFYIKFLLGTSIEIPILNIFKQVFFIIFLPLILGQITRFILIKKFGQKKYDENLKYKFPVISSFGGLGVVFVAIALRSKVIFSSPALVGKIFTSVVLLYVFSFIVTFFISKKFFEKRDCVAVVYGSVMRNLTVALAIVMMAFGPNAADAALVISVALIVQVQVGSMLLGYFKKRI